MANLNARGIAALVVADVLKGHSLTDALGKRQQTAELKDRPLIAELAYGSCRWWHLLDAVTEQVLQKPFRKKDLDIQALLIIGLYQLEYTRVPAHAAISETVDAAKALRKKWAVAVLNGILRRFQREREALLKASTASENARLSQPQWLLQALQQSWPDDWRQIAEALLERPPFTIRINLQRTSLKDYAARLMQAKISARPIKSAPSALLLDKPVMVDELPGFTEGLVSVQDAGAQLAAWILQPASGELVLDACAAPGGKTGHLLEMADPLDVVAVDVDESRLQRVTENLQRLNYTATLAIGDASESSEAWAQQQYDRILLDAPCSATGVIRRHPDIKLLRRFEDILELVRRQYAILNNLWGLLKPGGRLLYVTCSLLKEENEEQICKFVQQHANAHVVPITEMPGHVTSHGIQTFPGQHSMDGFYYALLEKVSV